MSQDNLPPTPPSPTARRASFAPGQKLTEMFGRSPSSATQSTFPGPIAAAAASAHANQRRRMSISTLGLSGSPNQTSPFGGGRPRKESGSSSASTLGPDESAIDESGDAPPISAGPHSPFSRRLSFGARAMRDARQGNGGQNGFNGRRPSIAAAFAGVSGPASSSAQARRRNSPPASDLSVSAPSLPGGSSGSYGAGRAGEGFNWSDNMRSRAERTASISGGSPIAGSAPTFGRPFGPNRAATSGAPSSAESAPREMPKQPRAPDHFQERILKGDFYMD